MRHLKVTTRVLGRAAFTLTYSLLICSCWANTTQVLDDAGLFILSTPTEPEISLTAYGYAYPDTTIQDIGTFEEPMISAQPIDFPTTNVTAFYYEYDGESTSNTTSGRTSLSSAPSSAFNGIPSESPPTDTLLNSDSANSTFLDSMGSPVNSSSTLPSSILPESLTLAPSQNHTHLTLLPSSRPSKILSEILSTLEPTAKPSLQATPSPSLEPTYVSSSKPSLMPTSETLSKPSLKPSLLPITEPSSNFTSIFTSEPSSKPTSDPSSKPTAESTSEPSSKPTSEPSSKPTSEPSSKPIAESTSEPSSKPTSEPSSEPTAESTSEPSSKPTSEPSWIMVTNVPSKLPTVSPSDSKTDFPSISPTKHLSASPSSAPTETTSLPTLIKDFLDVTKAPSKFPTNVPYPQDTRSPTFHPHSSVTETPSVLSTSTPTSSKLIQSPSPTSESSSPTLSKTSPTLIPLRPTSNPTQSLIATGPIQASTKISLSVEPVQGEFSSSIQNETAAVLGQFLSEKLSRTVPPVNDLRVFISTHSLEPFEVYRRNRRRLVQQYVLNLVIVVKGSYEDAESSKSFSSIVANILKFQNRDLLSAWFESDNLFYGQVTTFSVETIVEDKDLLGKSSTKEEHALNKPNPLQQASGVISGLSESTVAAIVTSSVAAFAFIVSAMILIHRRRKREREHVQKDPFEYLDRNLVPNSRFGPVELSPQNGRAYSQFVPSQHNTISDNNSYGYSLEDGLDMISDEDGAVRVRGTVKEKESLEKSFKVCEKNEDLSFATMADDAPEEENKYSLTTPIRRYKQRDFETVDGEHESFLEAAASFEKQDTSFVSSYKRNENSNVNRTANETFIDLNKGIQKSESHISTGSYDNEEAAEYVEVRSFLKNPLGQNVQQVECVAPKGKLGVVIDTTNGFPAVHELKDGSALQGKVFPGDWLVAIDDVDTSNMTAIQITRLMVEKMNEYRKFVLMRPVS